MGLATARALAQAGRDVVVCEQFELGHDARVEPRQLADRAACPIRTSAGSGSRRRRFPLWRELEAESRHVAARPARARSTSATGSRTATRSQRAECRSRCSTRARSSGASRSGPTASAASSRPTAASSARTRPWPRSRPGLRPPECSCASATASMRSRRTATASRPAACSARAAVVTAGAWAPALVGVDATPTIETVSYFDSAEPLPSVIDTTTGVRLRLRAAIAGRVAEGGHPPDRAGRSTRTRPGVADRELAARTAAWVERRFGLRRAGDAARDVPLHDPRERRVPARAPRPDRRRLARAAATASSSRRVIGQRLASLALEAL